MGSLRDKEIQVHATATRSSRLQVLISNLMFQTEHYLGEVNHWRKEFERMQSENDSYRKALECVCDSYHGSKYELLKRDAGINIPSNLTRRSTLVDPRPLSVSLLNSPVIHPEDLIDQYAA